MYARKALKGVMIPSSAIDGMSILEAALRGGAVVLLLLRVAVLLRSARSSRVSRYSALLLASIAAYVVDSAPGFDALDLRVRVPIHAVASATSAIFWMTMGTLFVDDFRPRWYHALAWMALALLATADMFSPSRSVGLAQSGLSVFFLLLGTWHALAGRATDLVEWRRRLRVTYAIAIVLYTLLVIASNWLWTGGLSVAPFSLANAIGMMALIFLFAVLGALAPTERQWMAAAGGAAPTPFNALPAATSASGSDAALLAALRKLIDHDKVYREPDLSIALLSRKLDIPEYRLRRLINHQLGHRNFSAFVNGYRLAEAEAALSDPAQVDVPVLTIALDAGFGSIGPFNRAFKAQTGVTPTEYRRTRLGVAPGAEPSPFPN
jgi:AraC-like DNA-binding protein